MSDRLKGKRAFVTAAAVGIGRACAIAFAREGASVFATDIDDAGLVLLAKDGITEVSRLDVRDSAAVAEIAKRAGNIDILLNAAGFVHHGTVLECSDEEWDFSFDLNVKSMHRTIRAFLPSMLDAGGGSIINISSAAGVFKAAPNRYVYGATKAAVAALTRAVATDFITKGVRCNCICPGTIETPMLAATCEGWDKPVDELYAEVARRIPVRRLGQPLPALDLHTEVVVHERIPEVLLELHEAEVLSVEVPVPGALGNPALNAARRLLAPRVGLLLCRARVALGLRLPRCTHPWTGGARFGRFSSVG